MNPDASMSVSTGALARPSDIGGLIARAFSGVTPNWPSPARPPSVSAKREAEALAADEVLVPVLDLPALDPLLVEPGAVGGAEVFDVPTVAILDDGGVLSRDFPRVDHQIA